MKEIIIKKIDKEEEAPKFSSEKDHKIAIFFAYLEKIKDKVDILNSSKWANKRAEVEKKLAGLK